MTASHADWAYYYPLPGHEEHDVEPLSSWSGEVGLVATGNETRTPSGRWREFRRSSPAEFEAVLARWETGSAAGR